MNKINFITTKSLRWLKVLIFVFSLLSLIGGFYVLYNYGIDSRIENVNYLLRGISPYSAFVNDPTIFRYASRAPVCLPQQLYLLIPFSFFSVNIGNLIYGIVGVTLLFSTVLLKQQNKNYLILLILLISTTAFRVNLGNGQFLFFNFGVFIFFNYFITQKDNFLFNYVINPLLLVVLMSKPNIFFWIPFYYPFKKRILAIYLVAGIYQVIVLYLFCIQTNISILELFSSFQELLKVPLSYTGKVESVYSVNFSTFFKTINSLLVISNVAIFIVFFYLKHVKKVFLDNSAWMFSCISLSFALVYHQFYDTILFLMPLFVFNENVFKTENKFFGILIFVMIFSKAYFLAIIDTEVSYGINNFLIIILSLSIQMNFLRRHIKLNR